MSKSTGAKFVGRSVCLWIRAIWASDTAKQ
jgi:hypothetical protein